MPMDFPDINSLKRAADMWNFRAPKQDESEADFRTALADYVQYKDFVESCEIRSKVRWDKFNEDQKKDLLKRKGFNI